MKLTKLGKWHIIFCADCEEPTPPVSGLATPFGFICDDCLYYRSLQDALQELPPTT
jgi:hypothetical protein